MLSFDEFLDAVPATKTPDWFCGCGSLMSKKECLADLLNCYTKPFSDEVDGYLDLTRIDEFVDKWSVKPSNTYGSALVDLILYFLNHLGYIEHSGSVSSSSYLTTAGRELRRWTNDPEANVED